MRNKINQTVCTIKVGIEHAMCEIISARVIILRRFYCHGLEFSAANFKTLNSKALRPATCVEKSFPLLILFFLEKNNNKNEF